jgi:Fibronectin type III domain
MVSGGIAAEASTLTAPAPTAPAPTAPDLIASAVPAAVPGAPAGLTATAGDTQVRLSWTAPASNDGSPVSGYKVYLATATGAPDRAAIGTTTGTAGTVTGLVNGTTYYFTVIAVNAAGHESPFSTTVSATPTTGVTAGLTWRTVPRPLIAALAAVAALAAAGAVTLIVRRRCRRRRSRALDRPAGDREPPYTVRFEPGPDVIPAPSPPSTPAS